MKTHASVPTGLLLFTTGMVAGLCLRPRVDARAAHLLQAVELEGADYLREAGAIDLFQIEAGKAARTRAGDPEVRAYAEKMVEHHQRMLLQMRCTARRTTCLTQSICACGRRSTKPRSWRYPRSRTTRRR